MYPTVKNTLTGLEDYYALGPDRSLTMLAEHYWQESQQATNHNRFVHRRRNQFALWSSAHDWQQRILKRDRQQAAREQRKRRALIEKLNEEQERWGRSMAALAMKQVSDLIKAGNLGGQATVLLFKYATDLQRLALGADAVVVTLDEESGDPDIQVPASKPSNGVIIFLPRKEEPA